MQLADYKVTHIVITMTQAMMVRDATALKSALLRHVSTIGDVICNYTLVSKQKHLG